MAQFVEGMVTGMGWGAAATLLVLLVTLAPYAIG